MIEGLAAYFESDLTGYGRVDGTYEQMIVASTAREHGMLGIDSLQSLLAQGYDAVFVGSGAPRGRDLDITGLTYRRLETEGPQQWPFPAGASEGRAVSPRRAALILDVVTAPAVGQPDPQVVVEPGQS